ncbi:hypothetical protein BM1_02471 [Bipolaris maydis]|nr:hypothetical protein BM1_02471 [Bipolaris maydis]KAJ6265405.1 hypothetical protein PSV08DRAFT_357048 [Bipolaris maydis]KAJ6276498.1 hypothetical protein J3E71DRAFT_348157 [Bipolaris maydis]
MLGLARTVRAEYGVDITTVEVDATTVTTGGALGALLSLYSTVLERKRTIDFYCAEVESDYEYAIDDDGIVKVPWMRWSLLLSELVDCEVPLKSSGALSVLAAVLEFRPDVLYLLIGGLGGLSQAISTWIVKKGARSLVYLSRSASSNKTKAFLEELGSQGCTTTIITRSVSSPTDVAMVVRLAPNPVAGVM